MNTRSSSYLKVSGSLMEFDDGLKNILTLGESLGYVCTVALRIYL